MNHKLKLLLLGFGGAICAFASEPQCDAYLFTYFEGGAGDRENQEQLRFAVSDNGTDWHALNYNRPVIASDTISQSGGIRDAYTAWRRR